MIVVFPGTLRAVISPVLSIVATPGLLDVQGFVEAAVTDPASCDVAPTHKLVIPDIVGIGFTVMAYEALQLWSLIKVIDVDPAATPLTTPRLETVAIAVLAEVQGFVGFAVPVAESGIIDPTHKLVFPEMIGLGFTVMVIVATLAHCPELGVKV